MTLPSFFLPRAAAALLAVALVHAAIAAPLPPDQREATLRYAAGLQNPDGGFRAAAPPAPSDLGMTNSCLRTHQYLGGKVADPARVERFVRACYDPATGGFAPTPGGEVSVRSTAMGVMAMAELKLTPGEPHRTATAYFGKNARSLGDLYIAAASLHAAGLKAPEPDAWVAPFARTRRPDGTYGTAVSDTARAAITTLRLERELPDPAAVTRALRAAQRPDGGFSAAGGASDLATSYPVMRAFYMLKQNPDLTRLREFVASCRNADGGYGPMPGQPSNASSTYFASIVLHWADDLSR